MFVEGSLLFFNQEAKSLPSSRELCPSFIFLAYGQQKVSASDRVKESYIWLNYRKLSAKGRVCRGTAESHWWDHWTSAQDLSAVPHFTGTLCSIPRGQTVLRKVHPLVSLWAGNLSGNDSMGIVWLLSPFGHHDIRALFVSSASPWVTPNGKGLCLQLPKMTWGTVSGQWGLAENVLPLPGLHHIFRSVSLLPQSKVNKQSSGEMVRSVQTLCWTLMFSELWGNDYKSLGRAKEES